MTFLGLRVWALHICTGNLSQCWWQNKQITKVIYQQRSAFKKTEQWVQIKPNKRIICCRTNGFFHAKAKDISTAWKFDVIFDVLWLVSNVEYREKEPNSDVIYEIWWAAVLVHMLWKLVRFLNQDIFQTVKNIWKGKIQISQDIFHKYKNGKINAHMKHDEIYVCCACTVHFIFHMHMVSGSNTEIGNLLHAEINFVVSLFPQHEATISSDAHQTSKFSCTNKFIFVFINASLSNLSQGSLSC